MRHVIRSSTFLAILGPGLGVGLGVGLGISLGITLLGTACQEMGGPAPGDGIEPSLPAAHSFETGRDVFAKHCAVCHGAAGEGDGVAAPYLFPPVRDLTRDRFRLVETRNGVPRESDLVRMLERGMPGSAMPSWAWLGAEDLSDVAAYVLHLVDSPDVPSPPLDPRLSLPGTESLALGKRLYERDCAACHGPDGKGDPIPSRTEEGDLHWARDFTAGYLKGGATRVALARRVLAGMPGTSMPAGSIVEPRELSALVDYVLTLIPEDSDLRLVQRREELVVPRVTIRLDGVLESAFNEVLWAESEEITVKLAPLWWGEDSVLRASVSALHDGQHIAIRMRWSDSTGQSRPFSDVMQSDGVALQLSSDEAPPLFGMGSREDPTTVWHWQSLRLDEVAGVLDLIDPAPHVRGDAKIGEVRTDVPIYHRADGVPAVSREVRRLEATGVEDVRRTERGPSGTHILPRWKDGAWEVVFLRRLKATAEGEVSFRPGWPTQFAAAIWNGAAGDSGPRKSISIWHQFLLEP